MGNDFAIKHIPKKWEITTLGEFLEKEGGAVQTGPFGSQLHASDYVEEGIPSVMPKNIAIEGINEDDIARITLEDANRLKKYLLAEGDIVYSRRGDVEKCALVKSHESGWLCGTGCLRVRLGEHSILSPEYLHAYLSTPAIREWISRNAIGATMPNLNTSILKGVPLVVPTKESVQFIADTWLALNSKITLNNQTNKTLEQMAQTLFKSWFVDFDPVFDNLLAKHDFKLDTLLREIPSDFPAELLAKAEKRLNARLAAADPKEQNLNDAIHPHFPSEFEHNEKLGWIPKGWEDGTLANVADALSGYAFKGKDFSEDGCAVIKIKNISADRTVGIFDVNRVPPEIGASASRFLLNDGDIIMAMTGATVGKFGVLASESNEPYYLNQRVCKLSPKLKNGSPFLFAALNKPGVEEGIVNAAQGSAQPNISANGILASKILVPSINSIELFNSLLMETFERKITLRKESYTLTKLRDTLLPKLISGELQNPDVKALDEKIA